LLQENCDKALRLGFELLPLLGFVAIWQVASWLLGPGRLPGPTLTVVMLLESAFHDPIIAAQGGQGYLPHVASTLTHAVVGCGIGISIGFSLALCATLSRPTLWILDSLAEILRILPPLIFVPFVILISGSLLVMTLLVGEVITIAMYSAASISVYSLSALAALPSEYVNLGTLLGAGRLRNLINVQLPAIIPSLIGPVRVIVSVSLGIAVVVEYLAAPAGIGRVMYFAQSFSRVDLILVGVTWVMLLALTLDFGISLVSKRVLRWTTKV
jgi:ABC-type nitrate/sulfonate/bicarbonate transport system permease component